MAEIGNIDDKTKVTNKNSVTILVNELKCKALCNNKIIQ